MEDEQVGGFVEDGGTWMEDVEEGGFADGAVVEDGPLDHDADGAVVEDGGAAGTLLLPASGRGGEEGAVEEQAAVLPSSGRDAPGIHGGSLGEDGGGGSPGMGVEEGGGENAAAIRTPPAGGPADHARTPPAGGPAEDDYCLARPPPWQQLLGDG